MTIPQTQSPSSSSTEPGLHDSQHEHITSCLDFHLHPSILTRLQHLAANKITPRVADVKCGTGVFLSSLCLPFPTHRTGFDTSAQPPATFSSDNPTFSYHSWDILSPSASISQLPASLSASFDVVVIRGLHLYLLSPSSSSLSSSSPSPSSSPSSPWTHFLQQVHQLLKPGAWVQWLDFDPVTARIAATRPLAPDAAVRRALHEFVDALRARGVGTAGRIDRELVAARLAGEGDGDADADLYPLRPKVEFTAALVREIGAVMERVGVWGAEERKERVEECLREVDGAGALVWYDLWCHVGRKAA